MDEGIGACYSNISDYVQKEVGNMQKYVCIVCGYIYDPEIGDETQDVDTYTEFEALPDSWVCPVCGVGKDQFEPLYD